MYSILFEIGVTIRSRDKKNAILTIISKNKIKTRIFEMIKNYCWMIEGAIQSMINSSLGQYK